MKGREYQCNVCGNWLRRDGEGCGYVVDRSSGDKLPTCSEECFKTEWRRQMTEAERLRADQDDALRCLAFLANATLNPTGWDAATTAIAKREALRVLGPGFRFWNQAEHEAESMRCSRELVKLSAEVKL